MSMNLPPPDDVGPTDEQMWDARDFPVELPRRVCELCPSAADVHLLATRGDTGETKAVAVCRYHLRDLATPLDWGKDWTS